MSAAVVVCLVLSCAQERAQNSAPGANPASASPVAAVEEMVNAHAFAGHVRFLAHDLLEGRGVGSRADALTRLYLATQLEGYGLAPGFGADGFEQSVPIIGITSTITTALTGRGAGGVATLQGGTDFTARAGRPDTTSKLDGIGLVFVGYGITAPEQNWDDFKGADVRGKVLLVMNNDPAGDPALFAGKERLYYGRWSYKYEEGARRGAAGVLIIHTNESAGYPFNVLLAKHEQEEFHLPFPPELPNLAVEAWCSEDAAKQLARLGGHDLDALRAAAEKRDFVPVDLGVRIDLATSNRVREVTSGNVVAKLPGSDPVLAKQAVIVTAHFDHLGIGPERKGDTIYNGAVDNASGVAAMLALARACAALTPAPKRSIYFAAVTAEESGLLGSLWLARNPPCPVKDLVANFNLDGINIWGAARDIEMIGHGKSTLTVLAEEVAARRGREVRPNQEPDKGLFYRSDHFSFAKVGVPSAYFKAGTEFLEKTDARKRIKALYTNTYYHQPSDEFEPARWQLDGAIADARFMLECLVRIANDPQAPAWTPGDEFEKLR
jgi:Zn-dependent M28 family amino/carboxypeptidase